jgi:hypothetical protein
MNSEQLAVILKSFDAPDEVRVMQKGKFELVNLGESQLVVRRMSPGGNGVSTSARALARRVVPLNTSGSFSQEPRPLRSMMVA